MLGKLIKHEFKATSRRLLPVLGLLLCMAPMAGIVLPAIANSDSKLIQSFYVVGWMLYGVSYLVVGIVALLLLIDRFNTHVLGKEGYTTMTLPVTAHEILWSKLIVFFVWFLVVLVVVSVVISATLKLAPYQWDRIMADARRFLETNTYFTLIDFVLYLLEGLLFLFVSFSAGILQIFASIMIGQQAGKYKIPVAVIVYVITSSAFSVAGVLLIMMADTTFFPIERFVDLIWQSHGHVAALVCILAAFLPAAVYYLVTALGMEKSLNLE